MDPALGGMRDLVESLKLGTRAIGQVHKGGVRKGGRK
jgi:hypothetical protein